jgi:hypothetical protein
MEVAMYKHSVALAALLAVLPISGAFAQTAPNTVGKATGDAWPLREELIYVPREALELPITSEPVEIEIAIGDEGGAALGAPAAAPAVPGRQTGVR